MKTGKKNDGWRKMPAMAEEETLKIKYKISDVAKLIGITPEALRYYEEQGVITPAKAQGSRYRYYGAWDIHILIRARTYRQYGYSLAETSELINHYHMDEVIESLGEKEKELEESIIQGLNVLQRIRQEKEIARQISNPNTQGWLEYRPPMYRVHMLDCYEVNMDEEQQGLLQDWISKVPFVYASATFPQKEIENGGDYFSVSLAVDKEFAAYLGLEENGKVEYLPPCICWRGCMKSTSSWTLSPQKLSPLLEEMKQQGMQLSGDVVSRMVQMCKAGDEYVTWHQLWMPVINID